MNAAPSRDGDIRSRSLWLEQYPGSLEPRAALDGDTAVDVAIVGGGYTGLWTAYYLLVHDPSLRIAVVEAEICGFGASGRNGGWCVGEMAGGYETAERIGDADGAFRQTRLAMDTVEEVGKVVAAEGIECDFSHGGVIRVARTQPQLDRMVDEVAHMHRLGFTADDLSLLDAGEAVRRLGATDVLGGLHYGACARVQPAKLVRGLADVVEARGATIYEQTRATAIESGRVVTDRGTIQAETVVRATEGYTKTLDGHLRSMVPFYSLMVATEPLSDAIWEQVGLRNNETFADDRYLVIYGQRTADGRIAFGGRGAPYGYGSKIDPQIESRSAMHELIIKTLRELFPVLGDVDFTHRWGGVLGIPRDWTPSVGLDRATGMAWAGGYVGEGVAIANFAGRTLADLILERESDLIDLPWVNHRSRSWEPEPMRWIGIRSAVALMRSADRYERTNGESADRAKLIQLIRR